MPAITFRNNGAIGALLDEYEKAVRELQACIRDVTPSQLTEIVDPHTHDDDCRSIQTILTHVVGAGYNYVVEIRKWLGEDVDFYHKQLLPDVVSYHQALDDMFAYNVALFDDHPNISLEESDDEKKIKVRWGQSYDVEQLLEHAIVHVLRHRRQVERFLLKIHS